MKVFNIYSAGVLPTAALSGYRPPHITKNLEQVKVFLKTRFHRLVKQFKRAKMVAGEVLRQEMFAWLFRLKFYPRLGSGGRADGDFRCPEGFVTGPASESHISWQART